MTSQYNGFINDIVNISNDHKFKKFVKETLVSPLTSLILKEIYPYVYISLILVIISFILIVSIFIFLLYQFKVMRIFLKQSLNVDKNIVK